MDVISGEAGLHLPSQRAELDAPRRHTESPSLGQFLRLTSDL